MFRIRIGLNMDLDPDPDFYRNLDPDPGSQINVNPDSGQAVLSQKLNVFCINFLILCRFTLQNLKYFLMLSFYTATLFNLKVFVLWMNKALFVTVYSIILFIVRFLLF